jgi:8-oxo-dGTP pyrophosphatase MutT (NUDIX family)
MEDVSWKVLSEHLVARNPAFKVIDVDSEGPEGRRGRFSVLEANDWALVVPCVTEGGRDGFLMVRQFRHGSGRMSLEFPGGVIDSGESPEEGVRRELLEETGHAADHIEHLASVSPNPAILRNTCHIFRARGLRLVAEKKLDANECLHSVFVPEDELKAMLGQGEFHHALMILALALHGMRP